MFNTAESSTNDKFDRVPNNATFTQALYFLLEAYRELLAPLASEDVEPLTYQECQALMKAPYSNSGVVLRSMRKLRSTLLDGQEQGVAPFEQWEIVNMLEAEVRNRAEQSKEYKNSVPRQHHSWRHQ